QILSKQANQHLILTLTEPDDARPRLLSWAGGLPADVQRAAFRESGSALHSDDGAASELAEVCRPHVCTGGAHAGHDLVDEVLDPGTERIEEHPAGGDPLFEQRLAGSLECVLT